MRILKNSFNAGELSPKVYGRYDLDKYSSGCKTLKNMVVSPHGGVVRRPGTEYVAEVYDSTKFHRLLPFEFSATQSYVIELGEDKIRFYKNGALVNSPDADTKLLTHCDGDHGAVDFEDVSTSAHTISTSGNAQKTTTYKKFGRSSCVCDGHNDYLSIADHADFNFGATEFTVDTWFRLEELNGAHCIYFQSDATATDFIMFYYDCETSKFVVSAMNGGTSVLHEEISGSLLAGRWYHIALIRGWGGVTNDWAVTVDGSAEGTFTAAVTMPDHSGAVLLGATTRTVEVDRSDSNHQVLFNGTATLTTLQSKFGNGSLALDGDSDYLSMDSGADWDILTQTNFTIDLWVRHTDHAGTEIYVIQREDGNNFWGLFHTHGTGVIFRVWSGGGQLFSDLSGGEIADGLWHHVAICKVSNEYGLYVDGTQVDYLNDASTDTFTATLWVGASGAGNYFYGYMNGVRITHSNDFSAAPANDNSDTITVPTSPHLSDSNTKLLLQCETKDLNGYLDEYRVSTTNRWTATFAPPTHQHPQGPEDGTPYSIDSPYSEDDLRAIEYTQSADVMYLTHNDYPTKTLTRSGDYSWAIANVVFTNAPATWGGSSSDGYPLAVTFYEDRLVLANNYTNPDTIWMSKTGSYTSFSAGSASSDDAITLTLAARKVNPIYWMIPSRRLLAGTYQEEWWVSGPSDTEPITPTNKIAKRDSANGSKQILPVDIGNVVLYVQRQGNVIREMVYDFGQDRYVSTNLTVLSEHLFENYEVREMSYQQHPYQIVWCVRDDGALLGLTYMREHKVYGWHKHTTDGEFESVACIAGAKEDELWCVVKRTIDGSVVRYVERLKTFHYDSLEDCFFVDCGKTQVSQGTTTVTDLDHLEGETVAILADGTVCTNATVSSGQATSSTSGEKHQVGLPYDSEFETLDVLHEDKQGVMAGVIKRITNIYLLLHSTLNGKFGSSSSALDNIPYDDSTALYTGWTKDLSFDEGNENMSTVFLKQSDPLPFSVLAVNIELEED